MRAQATVSFPLPRIFPIAFAPYTGFVVVLAMVFGGGARDGLWSDVVVQLAALPLLAWGIFRLTSKQLSRPALCGIIWLCLIVGLPLLQLIPLPPTIWSVLPGREEFASAYRTVPMELPWLPLSLDPTATWRSFLSTLPASAIFIAALSIGQAARRNIVALLLVIVFVSVLLDLLQMMGGDQSPLRFYAVTNVDRAVGFFANANHNAAFLYCAIPLASIWVATLVGDSKNSLGILLLLFLLFAIVIGLVLTHSRAGLALGFIGGLCCINPIWRYSRKRTSRKILVYYIGANLVALLVAFQFGFVSFTGRFENSGISDDLRWPVARITSQAAVANMPFGTGLGTFVPVYEKFEPRTLVYDRYINHAHNDWLELWLTGGIPAIVVALCFIVWFVATAIAIWRYKAPQDRNLFMAYASCINVALLLAHSIVDYPLRTCAISVLFGFFCAVMADYKPLDIEPEISAAKLPTD